MADAAPDAADSRLVGWKRIANYLGCSERTARRWEHDVGLPVHRQMHETQSTVYAHSTELDQWLRSRSSVADTETSQPPSMRTPLIAGLAAVVIVIVSVVAWSFLSDQPKSPTSELTQDTDALDLYERGRSLWLQRGEDPNRRAIALLQQAVDQDPEFAEAWSALASAWITFPTYNLELDANRAYDEAVFASDRALRLDPTLVEPRSIMATVALNRYDFLAAEQVYLDAIASDPTNSTVHMWLAGFYREVGQMEKGGAALATALELEPNSPPALIEQAMNLQLDPDPGVAADALDHIWTDLGFQFPAVWFGKWNMQLRMGDFDKAAQFIEETPHTQHKDVLRAYVDARRNVAIADLDQLAASIKTAQAGGLQSMFAYTLLDQLDRPEDAMDVAQAVADQNTLLEASVVMFDPNYPLARRTERFAEIVEIFGFIEYWRERGPPDLCAAESGTPYCQRISN
ncbi:MAG: tetratricopeptide repeat protein [Pseudomonadota bacterium]